MVAARRISSSLDTPLKIRVLIDARKIFGGGIGVYVQNLLRGLKQTDTFVGAIFSPHDIEQLEEFHADLLESVEVYVDAAKPYSFDELFRMPERIPFENFDIFHTPHYVLPYGIGIPSIVTVHDIIHITHGQRFFYPMLAKFLISSAAKRATKVVTVSKASKEALLDVFGAELSDKLRVVANSVGRELPESLEEPVNEEPYLLSVFSNRKPHKGFEDLLLAYLKYARQEVSGVIPLYLVGQGIEGLQAKKLPKDIRDSVEIIGRVSPTRLNSLYKNARALIVSSEAEGFCLPVLEAHVHGTPVLIRPVTATRELLLEEDCECADFSIHALCEGIKELLAKPLNRQALLESFRVQVKERYSLEITTTEILQVYREALG